MQSQSDKIRVWDPLVRIGHWTLVAAFFIAYFTAEELEDVHVSAGYWVGSYVVVRIFWGFVGTKYARFTDFVRGPRAILGYLSSFFSKPHKHYLGHNPAGGAMIVALLLSLAATAFTGLMVEAAAENEGPLASWFGSTIPAGASLRESHEQKGDERAEMEKSPKAHTYKEVHEAFANLSLGLVTLHILGVLAGVFIHRENLVDAMITGDKPSPDEDASMGGR